MLVLNGWDHGVIVFYALLIGSFGPIGMRLNQNPSAYFRGGGNMLWWFGAVSAAATGISTWTFTGGAAHMLSRWVRVSAGRRPGDRGGLFAMGLAFLRTSKRLQERGG